MILTNAPSVILLLPCHPLPDGQFLVDVAVSPVAGPDALVLSNLEVLLPDAPVLAQLDDLLTLLDTQQVRDNEALKRIKFSLFLYSVF